VDHGRRGDPGDSHGRDGGVRLPVTVLVADGSRGTTNRRSGPAGTVSLRRPGSAGRSTASRYPSRSASDDWVCRETRRRAQT
jgi:hypothetical protein